MKPPASCLSWKGPWPNPMLLPTLQATAAAPLSLASGLVSPSTLSLVAAAAPTDAFDPVSAGFALVTFAPQV
jgi:hypothetical protein